VLQLARRPLTVALVRLDGTTWTREPGEVWQVNTPTTSATKVAVPSGFPLGTLLRPALDREILTSALTTGYRSAAEDRGLEFVEGARARHCRVALDGLTFLAAFPAAAWFSTHEDLHRWRGALDYWVFLDGQIGQVSAAINGEAQGLGRTGLQANLRATLTATDRGDPVGIGAPRP